MSKKKKQKRERLDMVLTLNSIEHQVKLNGDVTHRFQKGNMAYYRRVKKNDRLVADKDC